jgi:hypothetical protein
MSVDSFYEAWRISYQSSEQAARAAFDEMMRLRSEMEMMRMQDRMQNLESVQKKTVGYAPRTMG